MAEGNRHLRYKEALNAIEEASPGSKATFYHGFLDRGLDHFRSTSDEIRETLEPCTSCGAPTPSGQCAFCRLVEAAAASPGAASAPVPVPGPRRRRRRGAAQT